MPEVSVKWAKKTFTLSVVGADVAALQAAIEAELSVSTAKQQLLSKGKRLGASDALPAAPVMLMAPADVDGRAAVDRIEQEVETLEAGGVSGRELSVRCAEASEQLDSLTLCGAMRTRRRDLLRRIDECESKAVAPGDGTAGREAGAA